MYASLRAVHTAASGSVAVVQQLAGKEGEGSPLGGFENELGHGCGILAEIHHQGLSGLHGHLSALVEVLCDDDFAELLLAAAADSFPNIGALDFKSKVVAVIDFCALAGEDLSFELGIGLGTGESGGGLISHRLPVVILLSVKDGGVLYLACNSGFPIVAVGAVKLAGAILILNFQHCTEGGLAAYHTLVPGGSDDLVAPPARSQLGRELIACTLLCVQSVSDIVSI